VPSATGSHYGAHVDQWWANLPGVILGAALAYGSAVLATKRGTKADRADQERRDLREVAARLLQLTDAMWIASQDYSRAVDSMTMIGINSPTEQQSATHARHQKAYDEYLPVNDSARVTVAELRLVHPSVAPEAEALWRASWAASAKSNGIIDEGPYNAARDAFIAKVQARFAELAG